VCVCVCECVRVCLCVYVSVCLWICVCEFNGCRVLVGVEENILEMDDGEMVMVTQQCKST